jgi:hypothetical protein
VVGRLVALVIALALGGAPVMVQVCEIHCTTPEPHACHQVGTVDDGPRVDGPAHSCGHAEALPAGSRVAQVELLPALAPVTAPAIALAAAPGRVSPFDSSPPPEHIPLDLRTPIRV